MTTSPPAFLATTPAGIVSEMVSQFEAASGRTLYPAQVERLLVDMIAYRESIVRQAIQLTAEQNLVDFATGTRLEALGRLLGIASRLAATPATCTWRIDLPQAAAADTTFAAGWGAMSPEGTAWATTADLTIPAGQTSGTVEATATTAGTSENSIPASSPFAPLTGTCTVTSLTESSGGAEAETDEQLRVRCLNAPYGFSVAGSCGAYRYHALGAHPSIIDVAAANLGNGTVGVYPLTSAGLPSQAVLDAVTAALSAEDVRPLCDTVSVAAPDRIAFTLEVNLTTYATASAATVQAAVTAAAQAYLADRRAGLGRDLIASQVIQRLAAVEGVYKVELLNWTDRALASNEWADGSLALHLIGSANG